MKKTQLSQLEFSLQPITVPIDMSISDLLHHFARQPTMRHIYVVNEEKELLGIIHRKKIFMLVFSSHMEIPSRVSDLYQAVSARTAGDLYDRNTGALKISDTIESAISEIFNTEFFEIPIVDEENHPVATLTAWDLLKNWEEEKVLSREK